MNSIIAAISFLTIVPIKNFKINNEIFRNSLKFFPLVGLILGLIFYLVTLLPLNFEIIALLITLCWIVITGGFHLDGVADLFDALGSLKDRAKAIEIMKDSRVGAMGVISIVLVILSKFILIKNMLIINPFFLILPPVAGRFAINFLSWKIDYAKEEGLGKSIVEYTDDFTFIFSLIFTGVLFIMVNIKLILLFIDLIFFLYFASIFFKRKFGGVTGDILGCMVEISEVFILIGGLFFVS